MRVCPQCARKNKPRAKFCDQCGFEFVGYAGSAASTQRAEVPPAPDRLPPGDTAKGIAPAEAGVPEEIRAAKGVHRQTQKIDGPSPAAGVPAAGVPSARNAHNQQTIKVARVPMPVRDDSGPTQTTDPVPDPDPQPEATIQGAFYLRKQEAGKVASAEEHVGWLVETPAGSETPGAIWPVTAGVTYIGSDPEQVGSGVATDRPGVDALHAMIYHRADQIWILDLASPTGTLVNGERLAPMQGRALAERDELRLGELVLSYRRIDPQT